MAQLKALERRHGDGLEGLIALRDRLREQLAPGGAAASLAALELAELGARQQRDRANADLSAARHPRPYGVTRRMPVMIRACPGNVQTKS